MSLVASPGAHGMSVRDWLRSSTALSGCLAMLPAVLVVAGLLGAAPMYANPESGTVVAGSATIIETTPTRLDIIQTTGTVIIDWRSFSIGIDEHINFLQPSSTSLAINRVTGTTRSDIFGRLTANGRIMLLNPNGILFGPSAWIDVSALIATTLTVGDGDLMAGNFSFSGVSDSRASVVN